MARSYLARDEEVVRVTRKHVSVLVGPAAATLAAACLLGALGYGSGQSSRDGLVAQIVAGATLLLVVRFLLKLRRWAGEKILITDRRLVAVSGLVARREISWPYARIHDLELRRSLAGRLLGYGTLVVESTRLEAPPNELVRIPDAKGVYRDVMDVLMAGPPPKMVELDDDDAPWWEVAPEDETDTGPLPRVVL